MPDDIEQRLVKARTQARSSMEWFRALRVIREEYFKGDGGDALTMSDWRKVMDRVDAAMKSEQRARWDF